MEQYSNQKLAAEISSNNLAYVVYTSGSTGFPKGVMVEHSSLTNLCYWHNSNFSITEKDNASLYAGVAFDASVWELFPYLSSGASLHIIPTEIRLEIAELNRYFEQNEITISFLPTQLAEQFLELDNNSLRYLLVGGEKLSYFKNKNYQIVNNYGPTESTVVATSFNVNSDAQNIPIGNAIDNTKIYLLSDSNSLVPIGVMGEICIGGSSLARGYLNQAELTEEKFITNPFVAGERLYKTGDLGRWLADGNVEYLGRKDDQVKIRGYRIELGEIEHALLSNSLVESAIVVVAENEGQEKQLVAYLTSSKDLDATALRFYLKTQLPAYMMPAHFVQLEELPLTANGKIDKRALPNPEGLGLSSGVGYVAPSTELEQQIVTIWENVLQHEKVGVKADFFELGGHSLKAIKLINEYQKIFEVKLSINELFLNTTVELHAELIQSAGKTSFIEIPVQKKQANYAISDAQRRLWVLSQFEVGSAAYNMPSQVYFNQEINIENFTNAINATIERHEILRTVFATDAEGEVKQWILEKAGLDFEITIQDFRNNQAQAQAYITADSFKPFDLEKGPLFRIALLQIEDKGYVFYFNMHHIISDGWSMNVLSKDVFTYYEAYEFKIEPQLNELRIQYKDYAAWQLSQLNETTFEGHQNYWLNNLSGELPLLDLPSSKQRPIIKTNNGHGLATYLNGGTTAQLRNHAQQNGGSLFMTLLATWNVLFYRYTNQNDIIIGTPIVGRNHADLEDQIGCYLNTLALRNEVDPTEGFNGFYQKLKANTLASYSHQMYPFDRLVEELDLLRDTSRSAVFDVMLTLQDTEGSSNDTTITPETLNQIVDLGYNASKFDFDINIQEAGDYLELQVLFNPDVYDKEMVVDLIGHYKELLAKLLDQPEQEIAAIDYLSEQEKQTLLLDFNDTKATYPLDKTIVDLFHNQAQETPNEIAVVFEATELTYKTLNEKSNQLAHYLQANYAIQPDDLIGIQLERSEWMLITILAVLKSGGAYVPIDPNYPQERIDYIQNDANCKVNIDEKTLAQMQAELSNYSQVELATEIDESNLAYVTYTSGSTGKPKGVMITHSNLVSFIAGFDLGNAQRIAASTNLTFDISGLEIWGSLCFGKSLVLLSSEALNDPFLYLEKIEVAQVEVLQLTPSRLSQLYAVVDTFPASVSLVLVGGEALSEHLYENLKKESFASINVYGPTETTIWSTALRISNSDDLTIGSPLSNEQIYILNANDVLQATGVIGEISIGGSGVAKGYLNRPELTAEKFIENPFIAGERLYKTGDLGRWTKEGEIEFIGRTDDQVKIRGYRIELGEIEQTLIQNTAINQILVLANENQNGEQELVAYLTSQKELNTIELRDYLKANLPEYMIPSHFVQLEELPLNASGKIDRKALPSPDGLGLSSGIEYVAPRNEVEEQLVAIWENVLQKDNIGIKDDFFMLGGHSLKAIRLINEYQKAFEVKLSINELFISTQIEGHSELIQSGTKTSFIEIPVQELQANYAISDAQRRLWVLSQFEDGSATYNMPSRLVLNGAYNLANFKKAIAATVNRHEILRTVFKADENAAIKQWILPADGINVEIAYEDFRKLEDRYACVETYIAGDVYKEFDLENGPLFRAALLQVEDDEYVFYYNMHHIISDGWSLDVLAKDVFTYYEAYEFNKQPELTALRIQYKDYSVWQLEQLEEQSYQNHRTYWLENLSGELPLLDLPSSKKRPVVKTNSGQGLGAYLDATLTDELRKHAQVNGGSLFMSLLATWNVLFYRYTNQNDIVIGTPIAGRDHADLEGQIGCYINTLVLRNGVNASESFNDFHQKLKASTLASYAHQMYPFDRLVEELDLQRDTSRSAVFDVMLSLLNTEGGNETKFSIEELGRIVDQGPSTSKFDIEITFQEVGDCLAFQIVYNPDVYNKEMLSDLIGHYKELLGKLLDQPEQEIGTIDYLSEQEKQTLLLDFNDTKRAYPEDKTIVDLFQAQVQETPNEIALIFETTELTYQTLNEKSNQLAHYLQAKYAIQPDDVIGIQLERSECMIIAILAVLKSGGAYVPIDPNYPQERIDYIQNDANCRFNLDEKIVEQIQAELSTYSQAEIVPQINVNNLACVTYTSGSTGKPKGVMITHSNLMSFITGVDLGDMQRIAGSTNLTFDIFGVEVWGTLCFGKSLVLLSNEALNDPFLYLEKITAAKVEVIQLTPSRLSQLYAITDSFPASISLVLVGGEALNEHLYKSLKKESFRSINFYGPTETTIWSTTSTISNSKNLTIGAPRSNEQVYILNANNVLQAIGVIGEICIGGAGVAKGYLNRPELTAEKFIENPFIAGERLYKTGDLGRWTQEGEVEFIGRKDDQVKIRGYRIELGEIEQTLAQNTAINQVLVSAMENQNGEQELVAYLTSQEELNAIELREYLKANLPEHMIPSHFVQLEKLPLNASGKIDRKALPSPNGLGLSTGIEYVAPRNEVEEQLVAIWENVLQKENIGIKDDFFMLGGHSLKAIRLINEYQKAFEVKLSINELFINTQLDGHAELIQSAAKSSFIEIPVQEEQANYAISDAQRRLWVLSQFEAGSEAYNMPDQVYLNQEINIDNFTKAINATIERHEILRTVFAADAEGEVKQWIIEKAELGFEVIYQDFRKEQDQVQAYIENDSIIPFDLEKGPLFRVSLLQIEDNGYIFYYNMHHIISDGWSLNVLFKDVFTYYEAFETKSEPQLNELRIQYKDYSAWQLNQLEEETFQGHQNYWLNQLSGELPLLDLPSTKQRPILKTNNGEGLATYLDANTTSELKKHAQQNQGSLFMSLLATWNVLLYRYTAQKDIIIGTPVAGRDHADLEDQIGCYINTLALRNAVNPAESFTTFYHTLKTNTLASYGHQMYPFDRLVEELDLQRDTSRSAVFDVMLTLQNTEENTTEFNLSTAQLNQIDSEEVGTSKFDIDFTFQEIGDYLSMHVVYNPAVYDKEMVEALIRHYKQFLVAVLANPEQEIATIDYLSKQEKQAIIVDFNNTEVAYPQDKTIVDLFAAQAKETPNEIALVFETTELTYQVLNEKSNQLAHYLQANYAIESNDLIGIQLERSEWMVIAILAVLKSGGAYVPIDPNYPQERIDYIQKDADFKVCINPVELKNFMDSANDYSSAERINTIDGENRAYVIYTSGSTGNPKGVMVNHSNLVNKLFEEKTLLPIEDKLVTYCLTNYVFDVSLLEILLPLAFGGSVNVPAQNSLKEGAVTISNIIDKQVNLLQGTPTYFAHLLSEMTDEMADALNQSLRLICIGGESLDSRLVDKIKRQLPNVHLNNHYGPTEITVDAVVNENIASFPANIIGKPLGNTEIYILDAGQNIVPVYVSGELMISGPSVAQGYLNQVELTTEKFISNPYNEGTRLYKTGDLGRWLPDGNIEFLGRKDDQVKIRGYRIELGEIEQVLSQNKAIDQLTVIVHENANNEKELVAYLTSSTQVNASDLREYLKGRLPEYMIPLYFVELDELPLTANGKIDKKALPSPEGLGLSSGIEYLAPRNEVEEQLVAIWENVLQKENIGIKDDFFMLGGHSLKAIRLINEYQKAFEVKLSINELFLSTHLEGHGELIQAAGKTSFIEIPVQEKQANYAISDAQRRLWVLSQFEAGSAAYNMPDQVYLNQEINIDNFTKAINETIERHEILRTVFKADTEGEVKQWILEKEELGFEITFEDFRNDRDQVQAFVVADSFKTFDLENGPLFRIALLQVEDNGYVFYYNMHHIISDGWSMNVLSKDVFTYYEAFEFNKKPELTKLRIQYKDYSAWQLNQLKEETFQGHQNYWLDYLSGELPLLDLPSARQRPAIKSNNGQGLGTYIDKATTAQLKKYTQQNGGSLFMTLLATWNVLFHHYTAQQDIIIGTPIAGRDHVDLEAQIGCYLNTLALRNEVKPNEGFNDFHERLKANTLTSYSHQMYPFDRLVEELDLQRDTSRSAVFDVMLTLQNAEETAQAIELNTHQFDQIIDQGAVKAKFDLDITFDEVGEYLTLGIVFNQDVYDQGMIEGLIKHYKQVLKNVLANPQQEIGSIDYLSDQEKQTLLRDFNDTVIAYPLEKTIVDLFQAQVEQRPYNTAIVSTSGSLTYRALEEKSNQMAHYLQANYAIEPDDLVSILLERSEWMLIAIMGVLKSGAAYVPIDPAYPTERIDYIQNDSNAKVCLDEKELKIFIENIEQYSNQKLAAEISSNNLAYVVYTSGSTGLPKGVMVEHSSLTNLCYWHNSNFSITEKDNASLYAGVAFDASVWELF
ncbi:MAG: tyrocidine synthetase-3, partial [Crocinitomix sp.]